MGNFRQFSFLKPINNRFFKMLISSGLLIFISITSYAAERSLTWEQAMSLTLERNPELIAF